MSRGVGWNEYYEPFWIDNGMKLSQNEIKRVYFPYGGLVQSLIEYVRKVQAVNYYLNQRVQFQRILILVFIMMLVIVISLFIIFGLLLLGISFKVQFTSIFIFCFFMCIYC